MGVRVITLRVSFEEHDRIVKAAHREEVSMNRFIHEAAMARVAKTLGVEKEQSTTNGKDGKKP